MAPFYMSFRLQYDFFSDTLTSKTAILFTSDHTTLLEILPILSENIPRKKLYNPSHSGSFLKSSPKKTPGGHYPKQFILHS